MLKIKNIDAVYGKIQILHRTSLHIREGEIVSLIGANGAGKTTLLNVISGLHPLKSGGILFLGREIQGMQPDRIVGMGLIQVPETDKIFAPLTVLENLELGAYLRRLGRRKLKAEIEKVHELFPILRDRGSRAAGTLSGGERQMLVLGRAMMGKPKLLMLDEPSLGLAPVIVSEMFRIIQSLNSNGTTILLVEQNAREALRVSSRAYVMETGRIILTGAGADLLNNEEVKRAFLGNDYKEKWER